MTDTTKSARKSWTKVAFGDVVQLARERSSDPEADGHERFIGLEHIDPGDLRVRRWGNIADGVTFTNVFKPGQVLFGKRRAYQRKVAVADFGGVCSSDIYVLEPKGEGLLPELLPFICQTDAFFEHAVGTSAGSLSPRTNWDSLASFEFALPPIEEQRRLFELFESSGDVCECHRLVAARLGQVRRTMIESFGSAVREWGTMADLISHFEAGSTPPSPGRPADHSEVAVLKVSAVGDWEFVESENKQIEPAAFDPAREVRAGDLLVTRANADPNSVGRTCLVPATRAGLMLSDKTWRAILVSDAPGLPHAVLAWSKSSVVRAHIAARLNGTDAKNISQRNFLSAPAPKLSSSLLSFGGQLKSVCNAIRTATDRYEVARRLHDRLLNGEISRGL